MWEIEPHISFSSLLLIVGIKLKEQTIQPSRGLLPSELLSHQLWWEGPDWLRLGIHRWPEMDNSSKFHPSIEMEETCLVAIISDPIFPCDHCSSFIQNLCESQLGCIVLYITVKRAENILFKILGL